MPALDGSELTLLRTHPHKFKEYLAVLQPDTILACRLNGAPSGDPVTQINYDTVTEGSYGDVVPGMTLWVGTSAGGRQKGTCRIRKAPTSSILYIAEDSRIDWEDDDYLTVVENYEFWVKYPHIVVDGSITIYKDWEEAYSDQHSNWAPVAVLGPPDCQFIDPGSGVATVKFVGENSYAVAPGATISSYAWTFPDVTPSSSALEGTEGSPIEVTWDTPGIYWITLTVTDSNGKTHTGRRPIFIFSRTGEGMPYTRFKMPGRSGSLSQHGHSASFEVHGDADQAEFPDGAMVVYFTEDWYGDTKQSIGGNFPYREHIKFVGYIQRESTTKDPQTSVVTFEAATIHSLMSVRESFSCWIKNGGSASTWTEATNLTADRAALSLARYQSTLLDICDVIISGDTLLIKSQEFAAKTTLLQQLQNLYDDLFAHVACDKQGRLYFEIDPQMMSLADRAGIATVAGLEHGDWRDQISLPRPQESKTSFINLGGVYYPGYPHPVQPILSKAPGDAPAYVGSTIEINGLILAGQSDGNEKAGLALARDNNQFPDVSIPMAGLWDVFDIVPQEYVTLTLVADDTKRGIVWTDQKLIPRQIDLTIEETDAGRVPKVTITAEKDSYGPAGVDGDYPDEVPPVDPDITPLPPLPPPPPGPEEADGNLIYLIDHQSKHLYRTRNARAANPGDVVYEDLGEIDADTPPIQIVLDPWDPLNTAFIVCEQRLYKTTNLNDTVPAWTCMLDLYDPGDDQPDFLYRMAGSICQQGLFILGGWHEDHRYGTSDGWFMRTFDKWETKDAGFYQLDPGWGDEDLYPFPELSSHDASVAWLYYHDTDTHSLRVKKSSNINADPGPPTLGSATTIFSDVWDHYPCQSYHRFFENPSDNIALYGGEEDHKAKVAFCLNDPTIEDKSELDWGSIDGATLQVGGYTWGTHKYWALSTDNWVDYRFHVSDDGETWTKQHSFGGDVRFISGWPYDGERFYACQDGTTAPILISDDRGQTWQAQTGNWAAICTGSPDIVCCVPVWTE